MAWTCWELRPALAGVARTTIRLAGGAHAGPPENPYLRPAEERALRVLVTQSATTAPTEMVFQSLYGSSPHSFWLDSSGQNSELGRFSFLGDSSGPLARLAYGNVWQGTVTVHTKQHTDVHHIGFFDWLDNDLRFLRVEVPELPFDFALGWVGYAGYELKAECGGRPAHRSENPDAAMIFADRALAVDHLTGTTYLLALADPDSETSAREWLRATRARLDDARRRSALASPRSTGIRVCWDCATTGPGTWS